MKWSMANALGIGFCGSLEYVGERRGSPVITNLERISRPGRIYAGKQEIP
jgi:hypothetical protein